MTLPKLSIAAKLYAIFALMATTTIALSVVAVTKARHHAALTDEFESANAGTLNVEKVNGLIYAVVMELRGVYMSSDMKTVEDLRRRHCSNSTSRSAPGGRRLEEAVRGDDAELFGQFSAASRSSSISAANWRGWAPKSVPPPAANGATTTPTARCARRSTRIWKISPSIYSDRAQRLYSEIDTGIDKTALWLSLLAGFAVMLAAAGAW